MQVVVTEHERATRLAQACEHVTGDLRELRLAPRWRHGPFEHLRLALEEHLPGERVALLGPVQGHGRDPVGDLVEKLLVSHQRAARRPRFEPTTA